MNCSNLVDATGWSCAPIGKNALLAHAPLTLGNDGQLASFYILNDSSNSFYLTDGHAAIMHAADHGAKINLARIRKAAQVPGLKFAKINDDGEITAQGSIAELQASLWDALRATLAITNNEKLWLPKQQQERFASKVGRTLRTRSKVEVISKPRLTGASGHQIEFPLGVRIGNQFVRAIQTIGVAENGHMDWNYIYQSFGKLNDVKKASSQNLDNRLVVIERGAPSAEFGKAVTVLSDAATVIEFNDTDEFALLIAA